MNCLVLRKMHLVNFKGAADVTIDFKDGMTSVYGMNGTGKTTIFDAFTWLLFGKDSKDRKKFDIKTYDSKGKIIPQIPHEVSATLILNGQEITLCRRFNEKWVKPKGQAEKRFEGNEEERLYNDVPCNLKEWNEKIGAICSEESFKFITSPTYFTSQHPDTQRAMLFRMAGDISDEEIAKGNKDFEKLLKDLTGKTMEEYKKEIRAKKARIKAEYEGIPERIDERKRDIPQAEDWDALEKSIKSDQEQMAEIEALITDKVKAANAANDERLKVVNQLHEIKIKKNDRISAIKLEAMKGYNDDMAKQRELSDKIRNAESMRKSLNAQMDSDNQELSRLKKQREDLLAVYNEIKSREISFDENDFICPTCKRRFEIDEIEARQDEMRKNFNEKNAKDLEVNIAQGKFTKQQIEITEKRISENQVKIDEMVKDIETIKADPLFSKELTQPDINPIIEADKDYQDLCAQEKDLQSIVETPVTEIDNSELCAQRKALSENIDALKARLSKKDQIEKNESRIKELEAQYKTQTEEYAALEGIEFTIQQFGKAKVDAVESRINGLFSMVRFRMFDLQVNGDEVETCEATVNGVPYSVLNDARRINAGIDIINAICRHEGMTAPIFIDNAESVNKIIPSDSQIIRLVVTDTDKTLRVE